MMRGGEIKLKYNISSNLTIVHKNSRGVPSTSPSATIRGVKYKSHHCPHQRSKIYTTCIGFPEGINLREHLQVGHSAAGGVCLWTCSDRPRHSACPLAAARKRLVKRTTLTSLMARIGKGRRERGKQTESSGFCILRNGSSE